MLNERNIFHVHTYRCGHAENIPDEDYVKKAIALKANAITFTDHAPFPGDPFSGRMKYSDLDEYVCTLTDLKKAYAESIRVYIGLEIEYLPSFLDYYNKLQYSGHFDLLLLGQHHYEISPGLYNFQADSNVTEQHKYKGLMKAQIEALNTGLFKAVAHPDRVFQHERIWTPEMELYSKKLISVAIENDVWLERNLHSQNKEFGYWKQFWELVPKDAKQIIGYDAHTIKDISKNIVLQNRMR